VKRTRFPYLEVVVDTINHYYLQSVVVNVYIDSMNTTAARSVHREYLCVLFASRHKQP
jgi:hypothetical protein